MPPSRAPAWCAWTALGELFDAAETLGHGIAPRNERLAILTNGGGVGIIATDLLIDEGGELATLLPRTIAQLDKQMPRSWSHANPVDIVGDADGARYAAALSMRWPTTAASARCWR